MRIVIECFEPLHLRFPPGAREFEGKVILLLPELEIKWLDLPFMGALSNACLVSRGKVLQVTLTLESPVGLGEMTGTIAAILPNLQEVHRLAQEHLRKRPLLGKE